jgi:hypothetical protein
MKSNGGTALAAAVPANWSSSGHHVRAHRFIGLKLFLKHGPAMLFPGGPLAPAADIS